MADKTPEDNPLKRITGPDTQVLPLYAESVVITKRLVETARVCASRTTHTRQQVVEEQLAHEFVEVHRIPMNLTVAAVPPIRQEGDTTILSVVEEVVVVERRLVLREEVHFRRVRKVENHVETVTLREQTVVVTRTDIRSKNNVEPASETSL